MTATHRDVIELFCLAISPKRYALFNVVDGRPVIRKLSSHGLGHLLPPYKTRKAAKNLPLPRSDVLKDGAELWHHDLWLRIIQAALAGGDTTLPLALHEEMNKPAMMRHRVSNPEYLRWFGSYNAGKPYKSSIKPFNFMLLPMAKDRGRIKPICPFDRDPAKAVMKAFDRKAGLAVIQSDLRTYQQELAQYHLHPESKFRNGDFTNSGLATRRHVQSIGTILIGKEADRWEEWPLSTVGDEHEVSYSAGTVSLIVRKLLSTAIAQHGLAPIAHRAGVSAKWLGGVKIGIVTMPLAKVETVLRVIAEMDRARRIAEDDRSIELANIRRRVADLGLRATARKLGVDPSNLRRLLHIAGQPT